uniref:Putative lipocalin-5 1 n=1 Tax=Rhipicephalus microplus TaxID=6941 RepID=A0A6M2D219_RHIMP
MNPLAVAVLASVITASHCEQVHPIWQNESRLREYQIAWNSLNKSSDITYYQIKATELESTDVYTNHGTLKTNFTCWTVNIKDLNETGETAVRWYRYLRNATREVFFKDVRVNTVSKFNYTIKNAVEYKYQDEKTADPVIFTDGEMCDLFNVPRMSPEGGCELWVKSDYKDNVPPCCSFIYDLLCDVEKKKKKKQKLCSKVA